MSAGALLFLLAAACTSSSTSVTSPTSVRCSIDIGLSPATVGAAGGNGQISISVNRECGWEARSETDWIALASPTSGQGEATLGYTAAPNPVVSVRRGAVVVNDQRVEVSQAAAACTYALSTPGGSVDAAGGTLGVNVTAQASCTWTAVSQASWLQIEAGRDGNGAGAVAIRVEPNGGGARRGTILVAGQTYTVSQAAPAAGPTPPQPVPPPTVPPPPTPPPPPPPQSDCAFRVSPTSESVGANGSEREVRVQATGSRCSWTAVSNAPWISIRDGSGSGGGQARYVVAPNAGAARGGTLVVAGTTVTVSQEAGRGDSTISLRGEISDLSGRCPNFTFRLEGRLVRTNEATSIEGRCNDVRERREARVSGTVQPDGSVLALRLRVGDD